MDYPRIVDPLQAELTTRYSDSLANDFLYERSSGNLGNNKFITRTPLCRMVYHPETYFLKPNDYAPNNELPVLIYRDCLPIPLSEEKATMFLESHAWVKGGTWGHIDVRHFHPNTHECYGVFKGSSNLLLGCGCNDTSGGQEIEVHAGDVIVLPAGTAHCNIESTKDYTYIGVYPERAPQWRSELGKQAINHAALREEISSVSKPSQDPVNGNSGPLMQLWSTS